MYVVVNCRDVAFHKNHPEMLGLHFIRVFCFVRTFNKRIHVVHAFHKPYSFMKCPRSHPPGIRRGIKLVVLSKHHVDYWASCTNQPFYNKHCVVLKKNNMGSQQPRLYKMVVLSKHHVDYWASCTNQPFYIHFVMLKKNMGSQQPRLYKMGVLSKHHVDYWASCTNQPFYKHFVVLKNTWVPSSQDFPKWLSSQNTM